MMINARMSSLLRLLIRPEKIIFLKYLLIGIFILLIFPYPIPQIFAVNVN